VTTAIIASHQERTAILPNLYVLPIGVFLEHLSTTTTRKAVDFQIEASHPEPFHECQICLPVLLFASFLYLFCILLCVLLFGVVGTAIAWRILSSECTFWTFETTISGVSAGFTGSPYLAATASPHMTYNAAHCRCICMSLSTEISVERATYCFVLKL
jgi:hypothetical protein